MECAKKSLTNVDSLALCVLTNVDSLALCVGAMEYADASRYEGQWKDSLVSSLSFCVFVCTKTLVRSLLQLIGNELE